MRMSLLHAPMPLAEMATVRIPIAPESVAAGFPSPSQDYWAGDLDIAAHLVRDQASTFIWRVSGHSMLGAGIHDQDLLLVDRGIRAQSGHIVVAIVDAEYTVKRLELSPGGRPRLRSANPDYPDVALSELSEMTVWGVVTWVLHSALSDPGDVRGLL